MKNFTCAADYFNDPSQIGFEARKNQKIFDAAIKQELEIYYDLRALFIQLVKSIDEGNEEDIKLYNNEFIQQLESLSYEELEKTIAEQNDYRLLIITLLLGRSVVDFNINIQIKSLLDSLQKLNSENMEILNNSQKVLIAIESTEGRIEFFTKKVVNLTILVVILTATLILKEVEFFSWIRNMLTT
jgi:hypothetical protein